MRSMNVSLTLVIAALALAASTAVARTPPPGWPSGKVEATPTPELEPGDVNGGAAAFTIGKDAVKLPLASGTIQTSEGISIVSLTFKDVKETTDNVAAGEGKLLRIGFAANAPGPALMITMFAAKTDKVLSIYRSTPPVAVPGVKSAGAGKCTITVTKLEAKLVEGTAVCPTGMVDFDDKPSPAVTAVTFKATAL